jgi:hypothetical protein
MSILGSMTSAVQFRLMAADRLGLADDEPDELKGQQIDDYRPSFDFAATPDAWSESFHLGFTLGLDGEDPAIPAALPPYEARAFEAGVIAGGREASLAYDHHIDELAREREAELFLEPGHDWADCERTRAVGVIASRLA